ncbi:hypothetical protein A6J40_08300 [Legionella longbeachae]|nr:hypothetical protein A6J40_08300 [Legionella longbeachae]
MTVAVGTQPTKEVSIIPNKPQEKIIFIIKITLRHTKKQCAFEFHCIIIDQSDANRPKSKH